MKYLSEFRDRTMVQKLIAKIRDMVTQPWTIMEVCGGQTHSLVKNGILDLLPASITMVHGPGCPVCVTPINMIDEAIRLVTDQRVILCSFGDMLRVPGSKQSLLYAKARGADVRIVYSPLDAVKIAKKNPGREVVFFAVGFETTAPANGLAILQAEKFILTNFSVLCSHVLVPPTVRAILEDDDQKVQGFLAAGHVCTVMGIKQYYPIVQQYNTPVVVTGFEPVDLLSGILKVVQMLEDREYSVQNEYRRVVSDEGNLPAQKVINRVFEVCDQQWRGLGRIPESGLQLRSSYKDFDASLKFNSVFREEHSSNGCIAGAVLKGLKKPKECPHFGKACTPMNPLGAPMVSSEGACAAYYQFSDHLVEAYET